MQVHWEEFERELRFLMTMEIQSHPELLLEHDGGPDFMHADLYLATLYGFDEQVDKEVRLTKVLPYIRTVINRRLEPLDHTIDVFTNIATYKIQSNWATMKLDYGRFRDFLPSDVRPDFYRDYNQVEVALLRYKRG
jgi:hypothetical protein